MVVVEAENVMVVVVGHRRRRRRVTAVKKVKDPIVPIDQHAQEVVVGVVGVVAAILHY